MSLSAYQRRRAVDFDVVPGDQRLFDRDWIAGEAKIILQPGGAVDGEREPAPGARQHFQRVGAGELHLRALDLALCLDVQQLAGERAARSLQLPTDSGYAMAVGVGEDVLVAPLAE